MPNTDDLIQVPLYTILIIGAIAIGFIIALISVVVLLLRKVKSLERIRYGFGGKTLFSILALSILFIALPVSMYSVMQSNELRRIAEAQKEVYIDIQSTAIEDEQYSVSFMAIPIIQGEVWGKYDYDVEWIITGPIQFKKYEKDRNAYRPSYFEKILPSGNYRVSINVRSDDFTISKTEDFIVNNQQD